MFLYNYLWTIRPRFIFLNFRYFISINVPPPSETLIFPGIKFLTRYSNLKNCFLPPLYLYYEYFKNFLPCYSILYNFFFRGIADCFLLPIPPFRGIPTTFLLPIAQNFSFGGIHGQFLFLIPPLGGISITFLLPAPQSHFLSMVQTFPFF